MEEKCKNCSLSNQAPDYCGYCIMNTEDEDNCLTDISEELKRWQNLEKNQ